VNDGDRRTVEFERQGLRRVIEQMLVALRPSSLPRVRLNRT